MRIEPDQPVVFDLSTDSCNFKDGDWTQPVQAGDVTQFQVILKNCDLEAPVVTNGSFSINGKYWTTTGSGVSFTTFDGDDVAQHSGSSSSTLRQVCIGNGEYYRVEIQILDISEGSVTVYLGGDGIFSTADSGEFVVYGFAGDLSNELQVTFSANCDASVNSVNAYRIDLDHAVLILDKDSTILHKLELQDYITTTAGFPAVGGDVFNLTGAFLTCRVDWTDLGVTDGCYQIGIAKGCANTNGQTGVSNGNFAAPLPVQGDPVVDWSPLDWIVTETNGGKLWYSLSSETVKQDNTTNGGAGADLNGSTQCLTSSSPTFDKANVDFSIACWVKFDELPVGENVPVIAKWDSSLGQQAYMLYHRNASGTIAAAIHDGVGATVVNSTISTAVDTWYLCVFVYDSVANLLKISVNNETFVTAAQSTGAQVVATALKIGLLNDGTAKYLNGMTTCAGVWSNALTQADVNTLFNTRQGRLHSELTAPLTASIDSYWDMDEESGNRSDSAGSDDLTDVGSTPHRASTVTLENAFTVPAATLSYDTTLEITLARASRAKLTLGSQDGTWRDTVATHSETIVASAPATTGITLTMEGRATPDPSITVAQVTSELTNLTDWSADSLSQRHNLREIWECTTLIHMVNNHNALGFGWEDTTFVPIIRLYSRIRRSQYGGERKSYMDGLGSKRSSYYQRRKNQTLLIEHAPTYVWDFVMLGLGIDHFYVDGIEYVWAEDEHPAITWNRFNSLGKAELEIEETIQDKFNIAKGERPNSGAQPPQTGNTLGGSSPSTGLGDRGGLDDITLSDGEPIDIRP